ncbi:hypothetical protein HB364_29985 [Pseudoflavitalea sp. X16]|uniref:hypothetical protein n=1 Tax=Paraflavitalea devenefica TaxID=2716334 RepID=UPI00141FA25D|nr:hypothetical protein [Paraflavitalea devenefica]NII29348.1 hypothetical protein [Paraflavitalea devenefica]
MKYLNAVLTVIAVCLVLITCAVTGIIPAAHAKETNQRFVSVPVNPDGSLNVKLVKGQTIDVNIDEINGSSLFESKLPISDRSVIPVNIEKVSGYSASNTPIRVKIED